MLIKIQKFFLYFTHSEHAQHIFHWLLSKQQSINSCILKSLNLLTFKLCVLFLVYPSVTCPNGFTSTTGQAPCYQCAADSYSSNGQSCTTCPSGKKTIGVGKSTESDCKSKIVYCVLM